MLIRNLSFFLFALSLTACALDDTPPGESSGRDFRVQEQKIQMDDLDWIGGPYPDNLIDGLSRQLVDEINCIQPGVLVPFEISALPGHLYTDRNIPLFLRPEVLEAAEGVAAFNNDNLTIRSAYRDVAMQYFDWYWGQIYGFAAARPGSSRHQAGQAIDVEFHDFWRDKLIAYGWDWPYGLSDRPHFEWQENSTPNLMVESVRAFQRLWNHNNAGDLLSEDGEWGPLTESKMAQSQAEGFTYGGCDLDLDGFSSELIGGSDCDDSRSDVYPGAPEICGDGIDQDCVGGDLACAPVDEGPPDVVEDTVDPPVEDTVDPPVEDTVDPPVEDTVDPPVEDTVDPPVEDTSSDFADVPLPSKDTSSGEPDGVSGVDGAGSQVPASAITSNRPSDDCGCQVRRGGEGKESRYPLWTLLSGMFGVSVWRRGRGKGSA